MKLFAFCFRYAFSTTAKHRKDLYFEDTISKAGYQLKDKFGKSMTLFFLTLQMCIYATPKRTTSVLCILIIKKIIFRAGIVGCPLNIVQAYTTVQ